MAYDVERVRKDFPILERRIGDRPLVYLDNAATSQKPRSVLEAIARYYEQHNANIHRGVHTLSVEATEAYEAARTRVARTLGAGSNREIVFLRGTTEAVNLVAQAYLRPRLAPGDEIVLTHLEHHSNIVPWQMVARQTGARVRVARIDERGAVDLDHFRELLGERTRFAAFAHVSNALGTVNPVAEMTALAHARGVPVLIDGAQALPHLRVDVRAIGCDFYAFSSHKVYGPTGSGALYGRAELLEQADPYQGGGEMIRSVRFEETLYNEVPHKFEAGTPDIAGAIGLGAALDYLESLDIDAVRAHEERLLEAATRRLSEIPGLRIIGTAPHKAAVVSFTLDGIHPHDVGTIVDQDGVAVRTGHHCAQPVMERYGIPATTRASFAAYNTLDEIDRLVDAIQHVREIFA
jgi:cysteine desulfurase / selenocysteine lyase